MEEAKAEPLVQNYVQAESSPAAEEKEAACADTHAEIRQ